MFYKNRCRTGVIWPLRLIVLALMVLLGADSTRAADAPRAVATVEWRDATGQLRWSADLSDRAPQEGADSVAMQRRPLLAERWAIPFPSLEYPLVNGEKLTAADLEGKVVMLDFWASWCGPCLEQLPKTEELWQSYLDRDFIVIAVNVGEAPETARSSAAEMGLTMPIATYTPEIKEAFNVISFPTVVIADRTGSIRARWDRFDDSTPLQIHAVVERMFNAKPAEAESIAEVHGDSELFSVRWMRDLPVDIDAVAISPVGADPQHVWVATGRRQQLMNIDGRTELQVPGRLAIGELIPSVANEDGSYEMLGFRIGGTRALRFSMPGGGVEDWVAPDPLLAATWEHGSLPDGGIVAGTLKGGYRVATDGGSRPFGPAGVVVRGVQATADGFNWFTGGRGERTLLRLDPDGAVQEEIEIHPRLWRLAAASDAGFALPSPEVKHLTIGRFIKGDSKQLALATESRLVILDISDGRELYRASWSGIDSLAAGELDGEGLDRLLVVWGKRVALLELPKPAVGR
jgi:thiol-disulfide isomerase/thioredoxin